MSPASHGSDTPRRSFHAVVIGRVQGVGFRYFVHQQAGRLGIQGIVFNRRDGSVEVQAASDVERLESFLEILHRGPSMSRVDEVRVEWDAPVPDSEGFHITRG